jgi:hypothetical protein
MTTSNSNEVPYIEEIVAPDKSSTVSGTIISCAAAGIPDSLLIPLRPWDKSSPAAVAARNIDAGKAPAVPDPGFLDGTGPWMNLQGWENGLPLGRLLVADRAGANAGLRLGIQTEREPKFNFVAVDIDLNHGCEVHKDAILAALRSRCGGQPMPWRQTWPHRATVLLNVADDSTGGKCVWVVTYGGRTIGKIEWLAHGQQTAIAGRHYSGNVITWHVEGYERTWSCPPVKDIGLPTFPSYVAAKEMLALAFDELSASQYEFQVSSEARDGSKGGDVDPKDLAPSDLTPGHLIDVFGRMSNPASVGREAYKDIMLASGGAMRGIKAHRNEAVGEEASADDYLVADAAAKWATRWEGTPVGKHEEERQKWLKDFRLNGTIAGWRQLVAHADKLGAGIASERAQETFTAEPAPEGTKPGPEGTGKPDLLGDLFADGMPDLDKLAQKPALHIEYADEFSVEAGLPLVDGWIDQGELVAMVGAPGSFKTTLAADLAGCIAWERPWMGCKVAGGANPGGGTGRRQGLQEPRYRVAQAPWPGPSCGTDRHGEPRHHSDGRRERRRHKESHRCGQVSSREDRSPAAPDYD